MDKEYNIDDILSEVKKRREEENALHTEQAASKLNNQSEKAVDEIPDVTKTEGETATAEEIAADETPETVTEAAPEENTFAEEAAADETPADSEEDVEAAVDEPAAEAEDNAINIMDITEENDDIPETDGEEEGGEPNKKMSKGKKITLSVIAAIIALLVVAGIIANSMVNRLFEQIADGEGSTLATTDKKWEGMKELEESFDPIYETEATELASLQDMIKTWYYNGGPCKSTHVLNVMLIGEDTRGKKILDEGTRADSAIIASVNIDTKQITLTSILRDAWAYWETEKGKTETGQFGKINGAMSTGDLNAYINCVESLYKIDINNYVIVNFDSFESIIDELGGVTLELTQAEINEINNHQSRYGHVTIEKEFEGNKGKQKLNGKQALAYCRIRKLDSDNMRADRQKTCLIQIFNQMKDSSLTKLIKVLVKLVPYVNTNFTVNELKKIAEYAFTQGWLKYDVYMQNIPENNLKGGTYYGQWVWRPDYPADAYNLQAIIYGKSNITLAHIRPDTATCPETGFYSEGDSAMYNTITNDDYGVSTKVETTTKKED